MRYKDLLKPKTVDSITDIYGYTKANANNSAANNKTYAELTKQMGGMPNQMPTQSYPTYAELGAPVKASAAAVDPLAGSVGSVSPRKQTLGSHGTSTPTYAELTKQMGDLKTPSATPTYAQLLGDKQYRQEIAAAKQQYAKAQPTYGQLAEQMAQSGLTNSGVSDNAQRYSYAQLQQMRQNALADYNTRQAEAEETAKAEADARKAEADAREAQRAEQQTSYNQAYTQLLKGYTDENGDTHEPMTEATALAYLKANGYDDDDLISGAQAAYKTITDAEAADKAAKSATLVGADTKTVASDSLVGKLVSGNMAESDFVKSANELTGGTYEDADTAVNDMYKSGYITKDQMHIYTSGLVKGSITNLSNTGLTVKDLLRRGELQSTLIDIKQLHDNGNLSDSDWEQLTSGDGGISVSVGDSSFSFPTSISTEFKVSVCGKTETFFIKSDITKGVFDGAKKSVLNDKSGGKDFVMYDGELYIRKKGGDRTGWYKMGDASNTKKTSVIEIMKILAE